MKFTIMPNFNNKQQKYEAQRLKRHVNLQLEFDFDTYQWC